MGRLECLQLPMISALISTIRRSRSMAASPARPTFTSRTLSGLATCTAYRKGQPLLLGHGNVGGVLVLHADHVVAGVDMQDLAGDPTAQVRQEIERAAADVLDRHGAPKRRIVLVPLEDVAEVGDAACGKGLDRPG